MADSTATSRLTRLLALVPYVLTHQGVSFAEAAHKFGVSEAVLKDDLNLIFVSGLPGYTHLELIDVVMDHDTIHIRNADVIAKPMRLHPDEALALLIGLQLLTPIAGDEVSDLAAKIMEATTSPVAAVAERIAVVEQINPVGQILLDALNRGRRLQLSYYVAARDEVSEREVDPIRVQAFDGNTYLIGYCRLVEGIRHFRLDRILDAKIVDRPAAPPRDSETSLFGSLPADERVVIRIEPSATWLIDYLSATDHGDGTISATLAEPEFFIRLALSMAQEIQVLSPESIVTAVRQRAVAGLKQYQ